MVNYPIGISTACMYPMQTEEALELLTRIGFNKFEIFLNSFSELEPGFIRELKARSEGSEVLSIHPFTCGIEKLLFFSEYRRRLEDGIELYKRYYEAAAALGAKYLVLHGERGYKGSELSDDEYLERYVKLAEAGDKFGITLAQENVNQFRGESVRFIQYMHDQLGSRASFVLDIKQACRAGQDPMAMALAMGDRLRHVHINDVDPEHECLLPGCGAVDYSALKNILDRIGYKGDLMIEVYRSNFKEVSELLAARDLLEARFNG